MKSIFHIATLIGGAIAAFEMLNVVTMPEISAPQQAGAMAVALGWVIIPYCIARAVEQLSGR